MKLKSPTGIVAILALLGSGEASACGVCIEDKVAATYDHAVIERAVEKRQQVVFVAVDGAVDANALRLRVAAAKVPGVVAGTVRVSPAPAAFSFALDAKHEPARAVEAFRRALDDSRAQLKVVRIVREGKLLAP